MRIAALGMLQETNTFKSTPTTYESFERVEMLRGDEIAARHRTASSSLTGCFEGAGRFGFDLIPLFFTTTGPTSWITKDAFDRITAEMMHLLHQHGPWDGVLLCQHGAAASEEFPDMDGEVARRVRQAVGPGVPVAMTLDLHSNITWKMVDNVTATVVYRTNPHLDAKERAIEAADILVRTIRDELHPVQWLEQIPMVINIVKQATSLEPMRSVMNDVETVIQRPGILSASCGQGYPYTDVNEMGVSFLVVADGDTDAARDAARWLARRTWANRALFNNDAPSVTESLTRAMNAPEGEGPTVIMDVGDNVGAGDSTFLLAEARRLGVRGLLMTLLDPEAVQQCIAAGVGADLTLKVGGKTDHMHGEPVEVTGHVRAISDGRFEETGPIHGGFRFFNAGTMAALDTTDGHSLVLTSRRVPNISRQQMYSIGIFPERYRVVVAKGVVAPRAAYEPIAREILMANTPGVTSANLSTFDYRNRRRPLYPFEEDATYE